MKVNLVKFAFVGAVVASLSLVPVLAQAQDNSSGDSSTQTAPVKKHKFTPYHGKVESVDTSAQTLTVGSLTLQVGSSTKISNAATHEDATLDSIKPGEFVSGAYKKTSDGNLEAISIHIGKKSHAHKTPPSDGSANTNSVAN